jgi:hypothetical protein
MPLDFFFRIKKCPWPGSSLNSFIYMIPFFLFLSNIKNTIPHKIICTKVEDGVASPILKSVGFTVRLIRYETGIRTPKAPTIP